MKSWPAELEASADTRPRYSWEQPTSAKPTWPRVSPQLTSDVREVLTVPGTLAARKVDGGTAPVQVAEQLTQLWVAVAEQAAWAAG